jgi:hypothetical protein
MAQQGRRLARAGLNVRSCRCQSELTWGVIPVEARVTATAFTTSLFPEDGIPASAQGRGSQSTVLASGRSAYFQHLGLAQRVPLGLLDGVELGDGQRGAPQPVQEP